jgi:hypothetical protein
MESKSFVEIVPDSSTAFDFRPAILHQCVCGGTMWKLVVSFENYEISQYLLDMQCLNCGSMAIAPTPIDNPEIDSL